MKNLQATPIVITGVGRIRGGESFVVRQGFKFLSPASRYAVAAAQLALEAAGLWEKAVYPPESQGVFVGTNFGVHDVAEAMDKVVLSQGAGELLAVETPNFSVNIPASYISMKCRLLAFNVTLTNMLVAGLEAVMLGARSIQSGRAQCVLAGATEGNIPARFGALLGGAASEGGSCLLALEALPAAQARGARMLARIGEHVLGFIPPRATETALSWQRQEPLLRRYLDRLFTDPRARDLVMMDSSDPFVQRVNETALRHFDQQGVSICPHPPLMAGAADASVSPLLWLADAIARQGPALLLVASPQGHIALLSLEPVGASASSGRLSTEATDVGRAVHSLG